METLTGYVIALMATLVMLAGPWLFAIGIAMILPELGAVALGIGIIAIPVIVMHAIL
jgi:hypothetical protein